MSTKGSPVTKRPLITGPLDSEEMEIVLRLRSMDWSIAAIGREMCRSTHVIGRFLASRLRAEQEAEIRRRQFEIAQAARREALAADPDYMLIASLWPGGRGVYTILALVNHSRKGRGLKAMEMEELHRIAVRNGLARPDAPRPRRVA